MTLFLFFKMFYLTTISDALVCYQCNSPSTISNPLLKYLVDAFLKDQVEENRLDSVNIFCNNIDDLGEEKTCDSGSYCYSEELQPIDSKEKYAVRSCVKQDQENPDIMECTETDNEIYNSKQKECRCNTNNCNDSNNDTDNGNTNGTDNGNTNGNTNGTGNGNANGSGNGKVTYFMLHIAHTV